MSTNNWLIGTVGHPIEMSMASNITDFEVRRVYLFTISSTFTFCHKDESSRARYGFVHISAFVLF